MLRITALRYLQSAVIVGIFGVSGCSPVPGEESSFSHDLDGDTTPRSHDNFDSDDSKFTFAVFSDPTGGERNRVFEIAMASRPGEGHSRPVHKRLNLPKNNGEKRNVDENNNEPPDWSIAPQHAHKAHQSCSYSRYSR